MDKQSFVDMAVGDLFRPEKPEISENREKDGIVEMAIGDLTGQNKTVNAKAPDTPKSKVNLAEAFSKSVDGQVNEINNKDEIKDTLAKDIYDAGQDVLERTLKGLR